MAPDRREARIAAVLKDAERIHGIVTAKEGGRDPDWALFYAWWLARWSDLPEILGATPVISELTAELVAMDHAYRSSPGADDWPRFYARAMLAAR